MKALLAFALLGAAAAAPVINEQYIKWNATSLQCEIQPGYEFSFHTNAGVTMLSQTQPADTTFAGAVAPNNADPAMVTGCVTVAGDLIYLVTCADGYNATGLTETTQDSLLTETNAGNTAFEMTAVVLTADEAVVWDNAGYDLTTATYVCTLTPIAPVAPVGCNYTCTGGGCANASGFVSNGTSFQGICNTGFVQVSYPLSCPIAGNNTTTALVCTDDTALIPASLWHLVASGYAHSEPKYCHCLTDPVCPDFIACSKCYLPCTSLRSQKRQATFAAAVFCPTAVTIAEMRACFEAGACAGAIAPGDTCVYGPEGAGTNPCPTCDDGSKKGLLGLLGLLGLIPLILLSLCCSLLLCLIRRKKKERDVHFATFDAGAPAVLAPCAEVAPVALTHSHVHHATYVGAPHVDVAPGCIAY